MADVNALDHKIGGRTAVTSERRLARVATQQHGVIARRQLLAIGLSRRAIEHRLATGRFHCLHRGVYAVGHRRVDRRGMLLAAVLAAGKGAVLSHRAAAELWGIRRTSSSLIEVTIPGKPHARSAFRVHAVRTLHPDELTVLDQIPVTSVARTLFDSAEVLRFRELERLFEEAERLRLFDLRAIEAVCERNPGRRSLRPVAALIKELREPPATRSELELLFRDFCRAYGIPEPAFNVAVEGYDVDAWWPGTAIIVELDSFGFHSSRSAFERDREKDLELKLAGFEVIRVTDRRIRKDARRLGQQVRTMLKTTRGSMPEAA